MQKQLILILTLILLSAIPAQANEDDIKKSVVKIFSSQSPPNMFRPWEITPPSDATGSGVLIEGNRILTNAHVVNYAQQIYVQPHESSDKLDATIEFIAPECDLATLTIDEPEEIEDLKPVPLADKLPPLKTKINVLGYPTGGDTLSVTEGVVSRIEYAAYSYTSRALRIQVDAAINPGNSGGPGIVDQKIVGIVFSKFSTAENIGYLIPTQVIRQFLQDCTADQKYDGFPKIGAIGATLENPDIRKYLKMTKETTGVVIHKITRPDEHKLLKPWDVVMACDGVDIDNLGMVPIEHDIRVHWAHLISSKKPGSPVKLTLWRKAKKIDVEVPTMTKMDKIIQKMTQDRPTYFIYGGLVFSPVTNEMIMNAGSSSFAYLGFAGRLLPRYINEFREKPNDELVTVCCRILPHKLTKGYGITPLSIVTHINNQPVKNLRQMIELVKEIKNEYIVFRFEQDYEEKIVLDPKRVARYQQEILRNNNIPSPCSDNLKDIWP
jgi:S1-C subfamily serine protease